MITRQQFRLHRLQGEADFRKVLDDFQTAGLEPLLLDDGTIAGFKSDLTLEQFIENAMPLLRQYHSRVQPGSLIEWKDSHNEWMTRFNGDRVLTVVSTDRHRQGATR